MIPYFFIVSLSILVHFKFINIFNIKTSIQTNFIKTKFYLIFLKINKTTVYKNGRSHKNDK